MGQGIGLSGLSFLYFGLYEACCPDAQDIMPMIIRSEMILNFSMLIKVSQMYSIHRNATKLFR